MKRGAEEATCEGWSDKGGSGGGDSCRENESGGEEYETHDRSLDEPPRIADRVEQRQRFLHPVLRAGVGVRSVKGKEDEVHIPRSHPHTASDHTRSD
jgi:hypothetical protein